MKYTIGSIVALDNGKTVYIVSIDEQSKKYLVTEADSTHNNPKPWYIKESSINMLVLDSGR